MLVNTSRICVINLIYIKSIYQLKMQSVEALFSTLV